jgi:nucleotide-binding universal stress UspA family protein
MLCTWKEPVVNVSFALSDEATRRARRESLDLLLLYLGEQATGVSHLRNPAQAGGEMDGVIVLVDATREECKGAVLVATRLHVSAAVIEQGKALAANYLDTVSQMAELVGIQTQTRVLDGKVAPSILAAVESLGADLIVMNSHGYTGFQRWALGSVAQKILPHSCVPVLVLRDGGPMLSTQSAHALVALDGSPLSETVLEPTIALLVALAPVTQKVLHVMRVVDLPVTYGKFRADVHFDLEVREEAKREAHRYLATIAQRLLEGNNAAYDLTVTTSVTVDPDVAETLTKTAEEEAEIGERFDVIAMATHGRGGLQRWLMGSVTERVLHSTKLPMLVVHAARQSQQTQERKELVEATR